MLMKVCTYKDKEFDFALVIHKCVIIHKERYLQSCNMFLKNPGVDSPSASGPSVNNAGLCKLWVGRIWRVSDENVARW